ncbi:MAG: hypothetical protein ACRC20_13115 [Segniliparus sp.]|uniref:hypothetical protein n=1 Tax=Segniliparus sp. TaxID=2804064 RepID=UPI003F3BA185
MLSYRIAGSAALLSALGLASAAEAVAEEGWSLSVCGTTDADDALVGSWSGTGESAQGSVDDMKDTVPDGLAATGPCFSFDGLTEQQAGNGQSRVRGPLSAKPPAEVWTALTGKPAPAQLRP